MHMHLRTGYFVYQLLKGSFPLVMMHKGFLLFVFSVCVLSYLFVSSQLEYAFSFFSACAGSPASSGQYPAISCTHRAKPASHVRSWASCTTSTKMQCCSGWWGPFSASPTSEDVWKTGFPGPAANGAEVRKMPLNSCRAESLCLNCGWLAVNRLDC